MRLESWFITNPDESQQQVLNINPDSNLIVIGSAGSGKTNMAIYRANQAVNRSFIIVVYTVALKKMVRYGLGELGLDKTRVVHEWSWINRGIDVSGDVFCLAGNNEYKLNRDVLILQNDNQSEVFVSREIYETVIASRKYLGFECLPPDEPLEVSIDFDDWVSDKFYRTFLRRNRWFKKICLVNYRLNTSSSSSVFVPSGFLFKEKGTIDYLIVDEGQDFSIQDYQNSFIPEAHVAITIFGDTNQLIYSNRGTKMKDISLALKYPTKELKYNYRIPKTIGAIAQKIVEPNIDLITNNRKNGGDSSYPTFKKPVVKKCVSWEAEIEYIISTINTQNLDDVAILLPNNQKIEQVHNFFTNRNINTQVRYTVDLPENKATGIYPMFRSIDTLDFTNNDLPCILSYHSAKGTEFDNVFIPFANSDEGLERNSFYVAITRSNANLYISYSRVLTPLMKNVSRNDFNQF
jgi:superfamily I DNA/RNA helicase